MMLNKYLVFSSILFISFLILPAQVHSQPDFEIIYAKTFESGWDLIPQDKRIYLDRFDNESTRYVSCEIMCKNNLYLIREQTHILRCDFYKPNGELFGSNDGIWTFNKEWSTTFWQKSYGYSEPGNWEIGKYRIDIYFDNQFYQSCYFSIYSSKNTESSSTYSNNLKYWEAIANDFDVILLEEIKFFESYGKEPVVGSISYSNVFPKSTCRGVYFQLYVENIWVNIKDITVNIEASCFDENDNEFGHITESYTIPSDWKTAYIFGGFGWPEAGKWPVGKYYVEIIHNGSIFATGYFTITND